MSAQNTRVLPCDEAGIAEAARLVRAGEVVAVPTETVYGLAADATNGEAVARIYAAKGRPRFNPLIVHVPDIAQAAGIARFDEAANALAKRWWPGPLTLVLPLREDAPVAHDPGDLTHSEQRCLVMRLRHLLHLSSTLVTEPVGDTGVTTPWILDARLIWLRGPHQ